MVLEVWDKTTTRIVCGLHVGDGLGSLSWGSEDFLGGVWQLLKYEGSGVQNQIIGSR